MKRQYLQKSCIEKQYVHIRNSLIAVSMACLSTSMMPCYAQNAKPKIATRGVISSQPGDYKQVGNTQLFYRQSSNSIDFMGKFQNRYYGSTFSNGGYKVALQVNNNYPQKLDCQNGSTINGVKFVPSVEPQGELARVCYTLTNNNDTTITINMGTHADVQIGDNDQAPISKRNDSAGNTYGITMSDGAGAQLCVLLGAGLKGVTAVSDYWFGHYNQNNDVSNMVGNYYQGSNWMQENGNYDSGMGWCWKNKKIAAGETVTFSYLIGVGDVNLEPNSSFVATPDDPTNWNNLNLPHRLTLDGEYESPAGLDGKIEYTVEDSEEWTALTDNLASGSKFSATLTVNFVPGKAKHTIRFRTVDNVGNTTLLAPIEYADISAYEFTGIKDYTFTGDSIYQQEITSSLPKEQYVAVNYHNNVHAGKAYFLVEGVFPYTIGSKYHEFTINPAQLEGDIEMDTDTVYFFYHAQAITPAWKFTNQAYSQLRDRIDYWAEYSNNNYPGTATLTVSGIGDYTGTFTKQFTIDKAKLPEDLYHVELPDSDITYDGQQHLAQATKSEGMGDILFTYALQGAADSSQVIPQAEGSYDIFMEIRDGAYYYGKPKERIGSFTIYQMDAQEWKLLTVLNATLIKMGWKEPWDMSQGEKSASQLKGVTLEKGHVKALDLSNQQLAGNLPATAFVLPKLESLNISHNRFKGNLGVLGRTLPALTTLDASYNGFTDVLPTLPAAIKQLNISNQTIDKTITVDGSHFNIKAIIPQLPTILAYDHKKQGYNTSEIGFLITQSDADNWYGKWGMHVIYKNGKLSVPYITTPFEYRGESGDTLTAVKLKSGADQSIEGSNLKLKYIFQQGDANFAPGIDATDLQTTILYAFGAYRYMPFNFTAADTYKDEIINVQDVVCTVNIMLGKAASAARKHDASRSYAEKAGKDEYDEYADSQQNTNTSAEAGIYLRDGKIFLNTEVPVAALSIAASGHINWNLKQLGMEQATEGSSLVAYSLSGNTLPVGETLIGTYEGDTTITGISLADEEAKSISSGTHNGTVTRINGISESNDAAEMVIFNTQGIRTQKMQKGINIVKTQKGTRKVVKK